MDELEDRIRQFKARIDDALARWEPFKDDAGSDWINGVRRFKVEISAPVPAAEFDRIEADKGFRFPDAYRAFVQSFGHFAIGGGSEEFCLFAPQRISRSYADYLEDAEFSDEANRIAYAPYLVCAEDGVFPQQDRSDLRILAFHRDTPELILIASGDEMGYQKPRDARQNPDLLANFLAEALDSIEEHAAEPLEGLDADIEFYSSEDDT